jgi:hypothetical protein
LQDSGHGRFIGSLTSSGSIRISDWFRAIPENLGRPENHYIFCGTKRGTGELVLQVRKGSEVVAETSAFIQIRDIKEMYERWTVGETGSMQPLQVARLASEGLPAGIDHFQYGPPIGATVPYILHVHGWNMETSEKDMYAEAMFKRLYWQGYQGRFGAFRWPTKSGFPGFWGEGLDPNNYDKSEWQAWKSGQGGLRDLLVKLNAKYPGQVRLSAHSMGNVAAGEALRTPNLLAHTYVAMQAAVPSHCYDATTQPRSFAIADDNTPNRYAEYPAAGNASYFATSAGSGRFVNFYNADDFALEAWETDQNLKPDNSIGYMYYPPGSGAPEFQHTGSFNPRVLTFPADTHELFAFTIEARCFSLGAQVNVDGVFIPAEQVDLKAAPYEFGSAHKGHSAQFRSTNMKRHIFWQKLLERMQLQ